MRRAFLVVLPLLGLLVGCKGNLSLVGLDRSHQPVLARIDEAKYQKRLFHGLVDVRDSLQPVLERKSAGGRNWELQLVVVGLGIKAQGGIGPFQAAISPGVRAFFTNTANPPPLP